MIRYISLLPGQKAAAPLPVWPRSVAIMGSTGSIGVNALTFMNSQKERFRVVALAGARNIELLVRQALHWRPPYLGVLDDEGRKRLRAALPDSYRPEILVGPAGYAALASLPEPSIVLSAQVGAAGLAATAAAAKAGKIIALANKESLVLAGDILRGICAASGAVILPVDSEHSALFQCLEGQTRGDEPRRIILTASGGPFRGWDRSSLAAVTPEKALAHPNWSMGSKISIDSATMMNKGLEIIEAHHLYGLPAEQISVLVHPESVIHSLVEFTDGSLLAQAGTPDMRLAIAYALSWPERLEAGVERLDLAALGSLTFEKADVFLFPCLGLAVEALKNGNGLPVVLNAANEIAVARFLNREIAFIDIAGLVERAMQAHTGRAPATLEEVFVLDAETRRRLS